MSELVLLGGTFALALLGQGVLAVCFILLVFSGGLDDSTALIAWLLLFVAALFNRFKRAAG